MKKADYWLALRQKLAFPYKGARRRVDVEGLAEYAHRFWKAGAILPDDYLPIPEKEEGRPCDVLRRMWDIVKKDPSFQTVVLDAYEEHYLQDSSDPSGEWYYIWNTDFGPFYSTVEAPQLRRIAQKAIKQSKGYTVGKAALESGGLLYLCLEYCRLKWRANRFGARDQVLFNNIDVLSLISDPGQWVIKDVEVVLETFHETRQERGTGGAELAIEDDLKCFDQDIRPVLVGRLMKEAKSFTAWQKIFTFAKDERTKIFALYHMSDKAKGLDQVVWLYQDSCEFGFATVAESAKVSWMEICSKSMPEVLARLPLELQIDPGFVEDLILKKCED